MRKNGGMTIQRISPIEANRRNAQGIVLIDLRAEHERARGQPDSAVGIEKSLLEAAPTQYLPDPDTEVMLICQSGKRSDQTAYFLTERGYRKISSVAGGILRWIDDGLPLIKPTLSASHQDFLERYSRHLSLPEVGSAGQRRLAAARILLVGAGGLGSPIAFYLAAAGVGYLRLADDDIVDRSNLQRQILHVDADVGVSKVTSAARRIIALNPTTTVETVAERVCIDNVERLIQDVDVVIDAADNFQARYLLNDACVKLEKPLVYGAVQRFEGQVSVFNAGRQRGQAPCYRCLFPQAPPAQFAPDCTEAGVLGVVPGLIGLLQATEALKLLLAIGEPLCGRLLSYDALSMRLREVRLLPDPECPVCAK